MKHWIYILFTGLVLGLTSCIEIIDDVTIHNDGSGTYKYTINLSASKVKINSILALDSLDGKKVPSKEDIENDFLDVIESLKKKSGISNVDYSMDFSDYIFKLQCDFKRIEDLQDAIKAIVKEQSKEKDAEEYDYNWISWDGSKLMRSIPELDIKQIRSLKQEDIDLLKTGNYTSITRFDRPVDRFENAKALMSKNKMAVMIKTDPYSLTQDYNLLENTIYLTPQK